MKKKCEKWGSMEIAYFIFVIFLCYEFFLYAAMEGDRKSVV